MSILGKIYNENCLDTINKVDEEFVHLTLTSPPYDGLRTYNGYSFPFEEIAKGLYRITKTGGVVVWIVGDATEKGSETGTSFRQALYFKDVCGFNLHDTMIYQKTGIPFPSNKEAARYNQIFEYMFIFSKGKPKTFNPILKKNKTSGAIRHSRKFRQTDGTMKPSFNGKPIKEYGLENNIWIIQNGMNKSTKDKIAFEHPAIFPEELVRKHILTWTNENDIIYDPFMGSGTTAKIAIEENREWFGNELSKEFWKISNERLKNPIFVNKFFNIKSK
jgi:DNA modification methylase